MLLAAGRGTRMEPLSSLIAKPALDVLGRPLLASALAHLEGSGCDHIVVNLHRHPEQVAASVRRVAAAPDRVRFSLEPKLLGGAGGVAAARPLFPAGSVLVANSDVWAGLDLAPLLAGSDDDGVTLALLPHPDPGRWSSVLLDADGRVAAFHAAGVRPPGVPFLFTGFQLIGARALAGLPQPPAEWRRFWLELQAQGKLHGVVVSGLWREAGTPMGYRDLVLAELRESCWVHPQADVGAAAKLDRVAVGAGCGVSAETWLSDSVVLAGAAVGADCRLEGCVIAGPVRVDRGTVLADTLVLPDRREPLAGE
jgi:N-acetyl-alpha-D-muramate 1-phosphate uridylyltransferase